MGKWLAALTALIIVFGGIFGGKAYLDRKAAQAAAGQSWPAAAVSTAQAQAVHWDVEQRALGTLRALDSTQITAQLAGNVTQIAFASGAHVRRGDLLVQLDDSTQQASLRANQARLVQARLGLERTRNLFRDRAVSQQEVENAQMNYGVTAAAVDSDQATLKKLRITAPFSGVLGIREVSLGQYVAPGTAIVTLQRLDPVLLDFALPQEMLASIEVGQQVAFTTSARPGATFPGRVTAIAAQVDTDTRNVTLQATLANKDERLLPGLFGEVTLALGKTLGGIAVPQTAITYSTFGDSVYVVGAGEHGGLVARARLVHVLARKGEQVLLKTGDLEAGDTVVIAGQNKLQDGAPVTVDNSVTP